MHRLRSFWYREFHRYSSYDNYRWEIQLPQIALGAVGVWPDVGNPKLMRFFILLTMAFGFYVVPLTVPIFTNDFFSVKVADVNLLYYFICMIIVMILFRFESKVRDSILEEMEENWENHLYEDGKVMEDYVGFGNKLTWTIAIVTGGLNQYYVAALIIEMLNNKAMEDLSFSNPSAETFALMLYMVFRVLTYYIYMITAIGIDTSFIIFTLDACAQLAILGERVSSYDGQIRHFPDVEAVSHLRKCKCLRCIVDSHVKISEFIKKIDCYLRMTNLLTVSSIMIAICYYEYNIPELLARGDYVQAILSMVHTLKLFGTLFVFCWTAEMCRQRGADIGDIAYSSDWLKNDPRMKRHLLLIVRQSGIPLNITAGRYFVLSLDFFKEYVLKSITLVSVIRYFVNNK